MRWYLQKKWNYVLLSVSILCCKLLITGIYGLKKDALYSLREARSFYK